MIEAKNDNLVRVLKARPMWSHMLIADDVSVFRSDVFRFDLQLSLSHFLVSNATSGENPQVPTRIQ